jgi:hypothetical protein
MLVSSNVLKGEKNLEICRSEKKRYIQKVPDTVTIGVYYQERKGTNKIGVMMCRFEAVVEKREKQYYSGVEVRKSEIGKRKDEEGEICKSR